MIAKKPLIVLCSGYRCGSTFIQRLLNASPEICLLGEDNASLTMMGKMIGHYEANRENEVEQAAKMKAGEDCWQANVGRDGQLFHWERMKYEQMMTHFNYGRIGKDGDIVKLWGWKHLFADGSTLCGAINSFTTVPHIVYLHRNLKDSISSYVRTSWGSMPPIEYIQGWSRSMTLLTDKVKEDGHINTYIDYKDLTKDTGAILGLYEQLEIDPPDNLVEVWGNRLVDSGRNKLRELNDPTIKTLENWT